jgi:hypothetical protein
MNVRVFPNLPNGVHSKRDTPLSSGLYQLAYGYDCTGLTRVRSAPTMPLGEGTNFVWDACNDAGVQVFPGWYTVRVSASNALGQVIGAKAYVAVEELGWKRNSEVAAAKPRRATHAWRGDWVVWTDARRTVANSGAQRCDPTVRRSR